MTRAAPDGPADLRPGPLAIDALLLLGVAWLVYGMLWQSGAAPFSKHSDLVQFAWPMKQVLYDAVRAGEGIPFWRMDQLSGNPAAIQPQSLHLYPLHVLYWWIPPLSAVGPTLWLELAFGAAGAYALGWALGLSRGPRLLMAVAQLCAFKWMIAIYAGWIPVLSAYFVMPWFAAALVRLIDRPGPGAVAALAAASALAFQTGRVQEYYYAVLVWGPGVLACAVAAGRREGARAGLRLALCVAAAGLLGLGLAAHIWWPLLLDLQWLSRGEIDYGFFLSGHGLKREHLWTLLSPEALGTPRLDSYLKVELWEDVLYFGWIPLALAGVGAVWGRPVGRARYLAGAAGVSLLLCFDTPLLEGLFHGLPGFDLFRVPSRMAFVTGLIVIGLAGLGTEALRPRLAGLHARAPVVALGLALAFIAGEGAVRARQYVEMKPHAELLPELPLASAVERSPHRTAVIGTLPLSYGWVPSLGIQLVGGYDPYGYEHYRRYLSIAIRDQPPGGWPGSRVELPRLARLDLLAALGVRYLLAGRSLSLPEGWEAVGRWPRHPSFQFYRGFGTAPLYAYERATPRDRASFVASVVTVGRDAEVERQVLANDLRRTAVVESETPIASSATPGDAIEAIQVGPGWLDFVARVGAPRFVRIAEVWHPGWRARVDGEPVDLLRSDMALMGLVLPTGEHRVSLRFRPPGWGTGLAILGTCTLVWIGLVGMGWRVRESGRGA